MSEIRELSQAELDKKLRDTGEELLNLRIRKQTGQVEKPHMLNLLRKDRARILTALSQNSNESQP